MPATVSEAQPEGGELSVCGFFWITYIDFNILCYSLSIKSVRITYSEEFTVSLFGCSLSLQT
jgi:hypothetical protein